MTVRPIEASPAGVAARRAAGAARGRLGALAWMALALGNLLAQPVRAMRDLTETDFVYAFMTAGRMLHAGTACFYCQVAQRSARAAFVTVVPTAIDDLYTNPPLAAWLVQPITLLPPSIALTVFLGLSLASVAAAMAIMGWRLLPGTMAPLTRALVVVAATASLPGAQALAMANWDGLLLLPVTAAAWAARLGRPLLAGLLLSTLLVKPQTVWMIPAALLLARSWRGLAGFATGAAVWAVSSLVLLGPAQLAEWPRDQLAHHVGDAHRTIGLPGLAAAVGGGPAAFIASALLLPAALALGWRLRRSLAANLPAAIALGLLASALTAPHIWPEDLLLAAVPLVLWAREQPGRALVAAGAIDAAHLVDTALLGSSGHTQALVLSLTLVAMARGLLGPAATSWRPAARPAVS